MEAGVRLAEEHLATLREAEARPYVLADADVAGG
jgi:hypothetical protein